MRCSNTTMTSLLGLALCLGIVGCQQESTSVLTPVPTSSPAPVTTPSSSPSSTATSLVRSTPTNAGTPALTAEDLKKYKSIWDDQGLRDYQIDYQKLWARLPGDSQPVVITVRNGLINSVVGRLNGQPVAKPRSYPDVREFFELIRKAIFLDYEVISVTFHPDLGYPTSIWLAYIDAPDVGDGFSAMVRPLPEPATPPSSPEEARANCFSEFPYFGKTGGVFSTPAVADGGVFVGTRDGEVYALDAYTGDQSWRYMLDGPMNSAPITAGGVVYVSSEVGDSDLIYALDASTGVELWQYELPSSWVLALMEVEGVLYVGSNGPSYIPTGHVHALDASTGREIWHRRMSPGWVSSPAVGGGTVYFASRRGEDAPGFFRSFDFGHVHAVDASTGAELWRSKTDFHVLYSPMVVEDALYVGSMSGRVSALDSSSGDQLWSYEAGAWLRSSPVTVDGKVYFSSWDGHVHALKASDGELLWRYEADCGLFSFPAIADGTVYVASTDRHLYALDALTGEELWRYDISDWLYSAPVVVDGILYASTIYRLVYALDASTGEFLWRVRNE